jgi:hypothetical protein
VCGQVNRAAKEGRFKETRSLVNLLGCAAARRLPGEMRDGGEIWQLHRGGQERALGRKSRRVSTKTVELPRFRCRVVPAKLSRSHSALCCRCLLFLYGLASCVMRSEEGEDVLFRVGVSRATFVFDIRKKNCNEQNYDLRQKKGGIDNGFVRKKRG